MQRTLPTVRLWPLAIAANLALLASGSSALAQLGAETGAPSRMDPVQREIAAMLKVGIPDGKRGNLAMATEHYAAGQKLAPDNGDLHYAFALVQLHNQQNAAGMRTLEQLLAAPKMAAPGACQTHILLLLSKRNFDQATSEVLLYADRIAKLPPEQFPDEEKESAARWLGRLLGFYLGPGERIAGAEDLRQSRGKIETLFSREQAALFSAGIEAVQKDFAERQSVVAGEVQSLEEDANAAESEALEKVFAGQEQTLSEKGKLKVTGEKLEAWRKERLDFVKQQLSPLMQQHQQLMAFHSLTDQAMKTQLLGGSVGKSKDRLAGELLMYEAQIVQVRSKIKGWIAAGMQVESIYYQAKGQVARKNSELAQFEQQLTETKANIKAKKEDRTQVLASKRKQESLRELGTYLPLDYRVQRDRLLARLAGE